MQRGKFKGCIANIYTSRFVIHSFSCFMIYLTIYIYLFITITWFNFDVTKSPHFTQAEYFTCWSKLIIANWRHYLWSVQSASPTALHNEKTPDTQPCKHIKLLFFFSAPLLLLFYCLDNDIVTAVIFLLCVRLRLQLPVNVDPREHTNSMRKTAGSVTTFHKKTLIIGKILKHENYNGIFHDWFGWVTFRVPCQTFIQLCIHS